MKILPASFVLLLLLLRSSAGGATPDVDLAGWSLAASRHFEVYSQAGAESAQQTLLRFEEIRAFFDRNRVFGWRQDLEATRPIRVVEFRSAAQYAAVRIHPLADAYYAAVDDISYIAMPVLSANRFAIAAHEYAHYALHAGGKKLPPWLNEGLAEVMSTVTITGRGCEFGGEIPGRAQVLRRQPWFRAQEFFRAETADSGDRERTSLFYSQSWAVVDMLLSAPDTAPKFAEMVERFHAGEAFGQVLRSVYGKSPEEILADARQWLRQGASRARSFPPLATDAGSVKATAAGERQVRTVIADLFATNGDMDRAKQLYEGLLAERPNDPDLLAQLGTLALRRGERAEAVEYWRAAVKADLRDAALCFRYAQLADQMDAPPGEVKKALEQVVRLRPDFDDARYRLAQMESNTGDYAEALVQLEAMRKPSPVRAFGYWAMLSSALNEVGRREEAVRASKEAERVAMDAEQAARAKQLAYFAQTEMQVQYVRDADGKLRLATTRAPRGMPVNPFVEAQDSIRSESGMLREVECTDGRLTAVLVEAPGGLLKLSVPDPARVLMRNANSEFTCGPQQQAISVTVDYATGDAPNSGLLRGLEVTPGATYKSEPQSPAALRFVPVPPGRTPSSKAETSSSPGRPH